jgi:hypothetical protein
MFNYIFSFIVFYSMIYLVQSSLYLLVSTECQYKVILKRNLLSISQSV